MTVAEDAALVVILIYIMVFCVYVSRQFACVNRSFVSQYIIVFSSHIDIAVVAILVLIVVALQVSARLNVRHLLHLLVGDGDVVTVNIVIRISIPRHNHTVSDKDSCVSAEVLGRASWQ